MGKKRIFDQYGDVLSEFEGHGDGSFTLHQSSDLQAFVDNNTAMQNSGFDGYTSKSKDFRYVGEIPNILSEKWRIEEGINVYDKNDWPAVKKKLNSIEFRKLRTALFRV